MPNMAVGQRVLITAVGTYFGQTTMNTFLYRVSAVTGTVDDVTFANALITRIQASAELLPILKSCTPADVFTANQTWIQILWPTRFRKIQRPWVDTVGADAPSTTANVQGSISRFGDLGNRKNVGGIRVPIGTGFSISAMLTADGKAALTALANKMVESIVLTTPAITLIPQVGLPGRDLSGPVPVQRPAGDSVDMTSAVVQETTRVIRRRTVRVGI